MIASEPDLGYKRLRLISMILSPTACFDSNHEHTIFVWFWGWHLQAERGLVLLVCGSVVSLERREGGARCCRGAPEPPTEFSFRDYPKGIESHAVEKGVSLMDYPNGAKKGLVLGQYAARGIMQPDCTKVAK
eukprot:gene15366-biopygen439